MKRILTVVLALSTYIGAYAGGPDSNQVILSTTNITHIDEPEEWSSPKSVTLQDEAALDQFKQRLIKIWKQHTEQWRKDKSEVEPDKI